MMVLRLKSALFSRNCHVLFCYVLLKTKLKRWKPSVSNAEQHSLDQSTTRALHLVKKTQPRCVCVCAGGGWAHSVLSVWGRTAQREPEQPNVTSIAAECAGQNASAGGKRHLVADPGSEKFKKNILDLKEKNKQTKKVWRTDHLWGVVAVFVYLLNILRPRVPSSTGCLPRARSSCCGPDGVPGLAGSRKVARWCVVGGRRRGRGRRCTPAPSGASRRGRRRIGPPVGGNWNSRHGGWFSLHHKSLNTGRKKSGALEGDPRPSFWFHGLFP